MKRALILAAVLGLCLSAIFIMPPFKEVSCAMDLAIPIRMGNIDARSYPPSQREIDILAKDTQFSKAYCRIPRVEEISYITGMTPFDVVDLSIVVSGHDLANSIHRPERCMPAQGHRIQSSTKDSLQLSGNRQVPMTRLVSKLSYQTLPQNGDPPKQVTVDCLTYYFFVGNSKMTNSHTERTFIDIADRVLKGEAQQWAYVSATMRFLKQENPPIGAPPTLELADKKIREVLSALADHNVVWEDIRL